MILAAANQVPPADRINEVAAQVLSRSEFQPPQPWENPFRELLRRIVDWLAGLSHWAAGHPVGARVLTVVLVAVLVLLVVHHIHTDRSKMR